VKLIMNCDLEGISNEAVVTYLKIKQRHSPVSHAVKVDDDYEL
jgi:hypothetical protein